MIKRDYRMAVVQEIVQEDCFPECFEGNALLVGQNGIVEQRSPGVVHPEVQACQTKPFRGVPRCLVEKLFKINGGFFGKSPPDFYSGSIGEGPGRWILLSEVGF